MHVHRRGILRFNPYFSYNDTFSFFFTKSELNEAGRCRFRTFMQFIKSNILITSISLCVISNSNKIKLDIKNQSL